ncbi:MAG: CAP domain-containing protein [Solirubrobacteraceae bacterium]|nr:CAP domain-containing protein [Solirubrobacteraceae bacterium]
MNSLRRLCTPLFLTALLGSFAVAAPAAQAATCAGADVSPAAASIGTAKAAVLCLLNHQRAARGLAPLVGEASLESAATRYSRTMVQERFFAHVSPSGQTLRQRLAAYIGSARDFTVGENLAWGEGARATPASIVRGWMNSDGHRANILNGAFTEIGIGIVPGSPVGSLPTGSATYTTHFGSRGRSASPPAGVSAASVTTGAPGARRSRRISTREKSQIRRYCHRVARRTKASRKTRVARYDRCMRRELRAAKRISVDQKATISRRCHRVARRTKASKQTRVARYDRCMRRAVRRAAR